VTASSIYKAANDPELQARVQAMANREVVFNPVLADSWFGQRVVAGMAMWQPLYWGVAVDTEAAYETAVNTGRGAPGYDTDIITDAALTAAITAHWPEEPPPITPPGGTP
jgi:hypothetical protein